MTIPGQSCCRYLYVTTIGSKNLTVDVISNNPAATSLAQSPFFTSNNTVSCRFGIAPISPFGNTDGDSASVYASGGTTEVMSIDWNAGNFVMGGTYTT